MKKKILKNKKFLTRNKHLTFRRRLGSGNDLPPANRDFITYVTSFFCVFSTITSLLSVVAKAMAAMSTDGLHARRTCVQTRNGPADTGTFTSHGSQVTGSQIRCTHDGGRRNDGGTGGGRDTTATYTAATDEHRANNNTARHSPKRRRHGLFYSNSDATATSTTTNLENNFHTRHTLAHVRARAIPFGRSRWTEAPFEISTVGRVRAR